METQQCGGPVSGTWECMYGNGNFYPGEYPVDRPDVKAEIGPGCRCGCIVHLNVGKPKRLIASSAESCPGRTLWLIQVSELFVNISTLHSCNTPVQLNRPMNIIE